LTPQYLSVTRRYHFRYGPGKAYTKGVYANDDEYFADVAKAYRTELKILYDNGLRNAQVDDPNLACEMPKPVASVLC
jgi:methionine synthase II (cobalamin-independent)